MTLCFALTLSFTLDLVQEVLELTKAANTQLPGLRLAVMPLGSAFTLCDGWPGESPTTPPDSVSRFVLRGPLDAAQSKGDEVRGQLRGMGLESSASSAWVLPMFCTDDFQTEAMMPFFFSEAELVAGWVRMGRPEEEAMFFLHTVMDLRALVANMANSDEMPWSKFQLVTSAAAYELAQKLTAAA